MAHHGHQGLRGSQERSGPACEQRRIWGKGRRDSDPIPPRAAITRGSCANSSRSSHNGRWLSEQTYGPLLKVPTAHWPAASGTWGWQKTRA